MRARRHVALLVALETLALLPLEDPQAPMVLTGTLRKWNPRPACGTAIKSVRISMSVFGFVPTRDEPAECLPWTCRTGVRPCSPALGTQMSVADSRWPRPYVR